MNFGGQYWGVGHRYSSRTTNQDSGLPLDTSTNSAKDDESTVDAFRMLVEKFQEDHKLTSESIKNNDDWRTMDEDKWEKLLENIDKYVDEYKERLEQLKKIREEAARKAAADAPADMKAIAAANAMTNAAVSGLGGEAGKIDASNMSQREPSP